MTFFLGLSYEQGPFGESFDEFFLGLLGGKMKVLRSFGRATRWMRNLEIFIFHYLSIPGVSKVPCFLEVFKYSRASTKHSFVAAGFYIFIIFSMMCL